MSETTSQITAVLRQVPSGLFILTSAFDGSRSGVLTRWVQPCSLEPPLMMVAVEQGLPIEPLIRDSRSFALCQVRAGDRLLQRAFAVPPDRGAPAYDVPATDPSRPSGRPCACPRAGVEGPGWRRSEPSRHSTRPPKKQRARRFRRALALQQTK